MKDKIAKIIRAETEGGYLQDWDDTKKLLSKEQQDDYFNNIAEAILSDLVEIGVGAKLPHSILNGGELWVVRKEDIKDWVKKKDGV